MKKTAAALVNILLPLPVSPAQSHTWYVKPDGTGDTSTVEEAIDVAQPGDEVLSAPGTYGWPSQNTSGNE